MRFLPFLLWMIPSLGLSSKIILQPIKNMPFENGEVVGLLSFSEDQLPKSLEWHAVDVEKTSTLIEQIKALFQDLDSNLQINLPEIAYNTLSRLKRDFRKSPLYFIYDSNAHILSAIPKGKSIGNSNSILNYISQHGIIDIKDLEKSRLQRRENRLKEEFDNHLRLPKTLEERVFGFWELYYSFGNGGFQSTTVGFGNRHKLYQKQYSSDVAIWKIEDNSLEYKFKNGVLYSGEISAETLDNKLIEGNISGNNQTGSFRLEQPSDLSIKSVIRDLNFELELVILSRTKPVKKHSLKFTSDNEFHSNWDEWNKESFWDVKNGNLILEADGKEWEFKMAIDSKTGEAVWMSKNQDELIKITGLLH